MASRSGMLHQGDIVLEINGQSVKGWTIDQVATFMVSDISYISIHSVVVSLDVKYNLLNFPEII